MSLGCRCNFKSHPNFQMAFVPRTAKHTKARLEFNALVDSSIANEQIPRLFRILLGCVRIHIWNLTTCAASDDVYIHGIPIPTGESGKHGRIAIDTDSFPIILGPRLTSFDNDIGPESFDGDRIVTLSLQSRI